MEKLQTYQVICEGGLDSNKNHLYLSQATPGAATELINFEPSLFGGYRRLNGFSPLEADYPDVDDTGSEGKILGIHIFNSSILVQRKTKTVATYQHFYWSSGSAWTAYTTGLTHTSTDVSKVRSQAYNFDGTDKIMFVDGVNEAHYTDLTDWYELSSSDTGADDANAGGDQAVDAPKYITLFKNHIFIAGDATYPNLVCHSAPASDYDWTAASGAGQINVGFAVRQIKPFRDELYVWGASKIKKIVVEGTDFVLKDVTNNGGLLASDSVVEVNGDLMFLAADGIRPIAATERNNDVELGVVSKKIQQDFTDLIANADFASVNAVVVRRKSQVRFFFSDENLDTTQNNGMLAGLKGGPEGPNWEWGKIKGIRASCVTSGYIGNQEYVLHGDFNGKVYRQESGTSFDGENIQAVYTTPYLDFGDVFIRKTLHKVIVFIRPEDELIISATFDFDWSSPDASSPPLYLLESNVEGTQYDVGLYDTAEYATNPLPILISNVEGSGFSTNISFVSDDINGSYSIQAIVFEFMPNGRK